MPKEAQHILIVEDDKSMRIVLAFSLKVEGCQPIEAATVAFGLAQAAATPAGPDPARSGTAGPGRHEAADRRAQRRRIHAHHRAYRARL